MNFIIVYVLNMSVFYFLCRGKKSFFLLPFFKPPKKNKSVLKIKDEDFNLKAILTFPF